MSLVWQLWIFWNCWHHIQIAVNSRSLRSFGCLSKRDFQRYITCIKYGTCTYNFMGRFEQSGDRMSLKLHHPHFLWRFSIRFVLHSKAPTYWKSPQTLGKIDLRPMPALAKYKWFDKTTKTLCNASLYLVSCKHILLLCKLLVIF